MRDADVLILAGAAIAIYLLLRKPIAAVERAGEAVVEFGGKIGRVIFDITHRNQTGEMLYYTATFPDGKRHAIPSSNVDASGYFVYDGVRYRLGMMADSNLRVAVRV